MWKASFKLTTKSTSKNQAVGDLRQVSLPVVGMIENMSGMLCPHCGERIDPFKTGGGETLAHEMNVPFLGRIPIDTEVVCAGDAGVSLVRDRPQSPAAKAFAGIVDSILAVGTERESARTVEEQMSLASPC